MQVSIVGSKSTGWRLVLDRQDTDPVAVVENASMEEAIDAFAANFPEYSSALDELKCEDDFIGVQVAEKKRQVRSGERKKGSGARFRELILLGKSNDECVKMVREEFLESRATISDAAWQRAQLRKNPEKFMAGTAWELNSQVIKK